MTPAALWLLDLYERLSIPILADLDAGRKIVVSHSTNLFGLDTEHDELVSAGPAITLALA